MKTQNQSAYAVGVMSGTSLDGVDAALVEIAEESDQIDVKLVHFLTLPFTKDVKDRLLKLCIPNEARIEDISSMNMFLGELFAEVSLKVIEEAKIPKEEILLISSHGQTIYHQPKPIIIEGKEIISTLQIGDIGVIAERTGIMTIGDFRTRDMAAGGQGAPLVPYADYMLFKEKAFGRVLVNIGGISNLTILPKNCKGSEVIAYDTGPGNMLIDAFTSWVTNGVQSYDDEGSLAAQGFVNEKWLDELLQHDYFKLPYPKSTGREMFGLDFAKKLWAQAEKSNIKDVDKLATITALTAKTIAVEINKYVQSGTIKEVLISGGGRYNQTLMRLIDSYLSEEVTVTGTETYGMSADAKEAIVFALLGYQCYHKKVNNLPAATGAKNEVVMGKIAW